MTTLAQVERDAARALNEAMLLDMAEIWRVCHVPTPSGTKAYTHFQRDFDQVRAICKKWLPEHRLT